jgi:hypothetical protein
MTPPPANPWDRLSDEPPESYARFLYYRNIGPTRSLRRAYREYLAETDGFTGGNKRLHVPGHWTRDATRHYWVERAGLWDCRQLAQHGGQIAALHLAGLTKVARKNLSAAARYRPGDEAWQDVLAGFRTVATLLNPEVLRAVADRAAPARPAPAAAGESDPDE